jgi:tRNA(fMet)-specific endonuclease VapC
MLLDTTFVIDYQRETLRAQPDRAYRFLDANPDVLLVISVVTRGELAEGFATDGRREFEELVRPYALLDVDAEIAWRYGILSRTLRQIGERIGDNDLWIAATALVHEVPLVTRDGGHFSRIEGLRILTY